MWHQDAQQPPTAQVLDLTHRLVSHQELPTPSQATPAREFQTSLANTTSFNSPTVDWLIHSGTAAVSLQETHLSLEAWQAKKGTLEASGWSLHGQAADAGKGTHTLRAPPTYRYVVYPPLPREWSGFHCHRQKHRPHHCQPLLARHGGPKRTYQLKHPRAPHPFLRSTREP